MSVYKIHLVSPRGCKLTGKVEAPDEKYALIVLADKFKEYRPYYTVTKITKVG